MGDGRLQDGDMPEHVRRQDGGGARDPLPQSEAARGNDTPKAQGGESLKATRTVDAGGRRFVIEEQSGTVIGQDGKTQIDDGAAPDGNGSVVQADGKGGTIKRADGVGQDRVASREGAGESGGGAYPNPHRGRDSANDPATLLGHGGQSEQAYHGGGQLGEQSTGGDGEGRSGQGG